MTTRPPAELRRLVVARAHDCCEYCLMPQMFAASTHQADHTIAEKHGGQTDANNLALSCMLCNLRKASDIASLHPKTRELNELFHPRRMLWTKHFVIKNDQIEGLTDIGQTTAHFMLFNAAARILERAELRRAGVNLTYRSPNRPR